MDTQLQDAPDPIREVQQPPAAAISSAITAASMLATGAIPLAQPKTETRRLVKATIGDLAFVDSLQKKFGRSLGFLPRQAIEVNLEKGNITLTRENDDAAGYLLVRPVLSWQPQLASIVQAAVCMDAQRRHHGLALLLLIEKEARSRGQLGLQANCAIGVEANDFWQAAGFKPIAHLTPETKSGREIICWRKPLKRSLPAWFTDLPARAGHRCRNTNSTRNANRSAKSQDFAERFLSAKLLPQGDPGHVDAGLVTPDSELGRHLLQGT